MTTLLAKQVASFKLKHGITAVGTKRQTPPSILFSPQEAKTHDSETFAALALHGLSEASVLEPKLSNFNELFEGSMRDRDLLTKEENDALNQKIHQLLLLLSPHLQARAAQECVEGLLYRYHAHRWNVDDLMAACLPHHDSPLFTKLIQGLHVESLPRWGWLATLKAKPAALIRSRLAQYCSKDTAVLSFLCNILEETLQLQLENRALMTFFVAIWLDTIALSGANDIVQVVVPSILKLLSQPTLCDAFFAGVTVTGALCAKVQLEESLQGQLLVRLAKQAVGQDGQAAFLLMAEILQLQEVRTLPGGVVKVLVKHGPEELLRAASPSVDAGNLLAMIVKASLLAEDENAQAFGQGLLEDATMMKYYALRLCNAVLQAFVESLRSAATAKARKKILTRFQAPAKSLGQAPLALGEAMGHTVALLDKETAELVVQLLTPSCATISEGDTFVPAVQAFSHKTAKVRCKAIVSAAAALDEGEGHERQQLMSSLALRAVEDENAEVVASALRQQQLWVSEKVQATSAVSTLVAAVSRLVKSPKSEKDCFQQVFLEEARAKKLLPLAMQAAAWVKSRKDLDQELSQRLELKFLPLILVALLGLDDVNSESHEDTVKQLQPAVLAFCEVSEDQLLQQVSVDTEATELLGSFGSSLLQAVDVVGAVRLCELVAGREGAEVELESVPSSSSVPALGGLATQAAASRLLQAALPSLVETLKSTRPKALQLIMRSVEACERFAESLSSASLSPLKGLWKATLEAAASLSAPSGRRKSRGGVASGTNGADTREAIQRLMQVALRRPKDLAADLQVALGQDSFRPALMALALGANEKGVASANAMLMLKSLVVKKGWCMDQSMLALIMAKIACAQELQVRVAAVALCKALKDSSIDDTESTLEAQLLQAKSRVLPDKAWSLVTAQLGDELWSTLLELLLKNEKEMLQDRGAAGLTLTKILVPKGGLQKTQRQEALSFLMVSLARCDMVSDELLKALPPSALQSVKEPLIKCIAEVSKKGCQAYSLLACAMKLMKSGNEKSKSSQETIVEMARSVVFPLCLALTKSCEGEVPAWEASLADLACDTCRVISRVAMTYPEVLEEATSCLFRFAVVLRRLAPKLSAPAAAVAPAASSALAEVPSDAGIMQALLKSDVLHGKHLKEPQGEAAAQLICEQAVSLPQADSGRAKLLLSLANASKEAGKHLPKDAKTGGAVAPLMLAVAAVSEQLAKDELSDEEVAEVAEVVPAVCQAIDEASSTCLQSSLSALIRCCGALAMVAPASDDDSDPLRLVREALKKAPQLRPDDLVLLKGNLRKLWRYPAAETGDWKVPQGRLRSLLHSTFKSMEVSKVNCLAVAGSSGARASLDFCILLLLVHHTSQGKPVTPKKKRRKKKIFYDEEDEAELEALIAPTTEDVVLDEVFEMLTAVEAYCRYHAFGMLLMLLAAWAAKMQSSTLPWSTLLPDEVMEDLDEDASFKILRLGLQLASRFLSEHGLPENLDLEEVDTSVLLEMTEEKEGDVASALCHGLRALCVIEAMLEQSPGQSREEVQCRKQSKDLHGLLLRSLSVNHPVTFFRGLCLSLGVKGSAPKGNASTALADQDFVSQLSSSIMRGAAKALKDRRDLRQDEDMEEDEEGGFSAKAAMAIQHVCKRFLSSHDADSGDISTAWEFLDEICRFSQRQASSSLLTSALPKAGIFLKSLPDTLDRGRTMAAVKCCQCVETMVSSLGHGILPGLNDIMEPLLDLASTPRVLKGKALENSESNLDGQVLHSLAALCRSVGGMLSPFLGKFLEVLCAPAAERTKSLEELGKQLVEGVPHRLLIKEVQTATVDPFKDVTSIEALDEGLIRSQRLATFYLWILSNATPEFVAAHQIMPAFLRIFEISGSSVKLFLSSGADVQEIPLRLLKRETLSLEDLSWSAVADDASLQKLQMLGGACFSRFCLRLEPEDVKTRVAKVLDWARGKHDKLLARPKGEAKDEDASKTLALMSALTTLANEAEGLAEELLMPLANKDVSSALKASHTFALRLAREKLPRKKRRLSSGAERSSKEVLTNQSWWWYDVAVACFNFVALSFRQGAKSADAKVWEESLEEVLEPCVAMTDVFEFLGAEDPIASGLLKVLQPAFVALTATSAEDGVKRMMQAILEKTRTEDPEVTLAALRCAHRIWSDLGVQVVMSLSEVVMYTSELQDHEDSRVEAEVKAMVRTIEDCTGESLHESMKT